MSPSLRRYLTWLALFATLLGASAPTVTRVLAASRSVSLQLADICSVAGAPPAKDPASPNQAHGDGCPFCFSHTMTHAPPPVHATLLAVAGSNAVTAAPQVERVPQNVWRSAQPRGPPVFS